MGLNLAVGFSDDPFLSSLKTIRRLEVYKLCLVYSGDEQDRQKHGSHSAHEQTGFFIIIFVLFLSFSFISKNARALHRKKIITPFNHRLLQG
uniref:Uncharacterized protein n=1 Tax=Hordeum vulgare subsp. vulgare TaxID=112509 RepID=A0A8I6WP69_HORVV